MFQRAISSLNKFMKLRGIDAVAKYEPPVDETVDGEIAFTTADGGARYPVAIQLHDDSCSVIIYEFDSSGDVCAVQHGILHTMTGPDGRDVKDEVWQALKANPPIPQAPSGLKL